MNARSQIFELVSMSSLCMLQNHRKSSSPGLSIASRIDRLKMATSHHLNKELRIYLQSVEGRQIEEVVGSKLIYIL